MRGILTSVITLLGFTLLLSACAGKKVPVQQKEASVQAKGGLLGSQFDGAEGKITVPVTGTVIGEFLGGHVGQEMDKLDQLKANQALETQKTGDTNTWTNPENSNVYSVTSTSTEIHNGLPCRDYIMTVVRNDGSKAKANGVACRIVVGTGQYKWERAN